MEYLNNIKEKTIYALFWKFLERAGVQIVSFILSIILARLLLPADYGIVAILLIFINIADIFVNFGLGSALIQKKFADDIDFCSVFYFSLIFSIFIYAVVFVFSPTIANFYQIPILCDTLRILGIRIPIAAINSIQQAYLVREMKFKKIFHATLTGTIISAFVGVFMAYHDFGVWALIGQYLSNAIINTIVLSIVIDWHPKFLFSINRLKELFNYGWKLLASGILNSAYTSCNGLVIGKIFSSASLGYFITGQKFPLIIVNNINESISSVLFPVLASEQDNAEKVKTHTRRAIQISSYIMWPIMLGMAACADSIVALMFTDKWLPAVPYLQIACITYGLWPIHTANLQAINAMGRSDIFLKLEIIKKIIAFTALFVSVQYSVFMIALSELIAGIIGSVINAYPNRYLLRYTYIEQMKDIIPSFLLSLIMAIIVLFIGEAEINNLYKLFLQIIVGVIVYIGGSLFFKLDSYTYIINSIKNMR